MLVHVELAGDQTGGKAAEGRAHLVAAGGEPLAHHGHDPAGDAGQLGGQLDVVGDSLIESAGLLRLVFPCDAEQVQGVYIPQSHIFQLALDLFGNGFRMLHLGDGGDHDAVFLRLFQIVFQTLLVDSQINHVLCPPVDLSR